MTHEPEAEEHTTEVTCETPSVATDCLNIIENYRSGRITKGEAVLDLTKTIPPETTGTGEPTAQTLQSYVGMLDDWDRERTLSEAEERRGESVNERNRTRGDNDNDECEEPVHKRPKINADLFPWSLSNKIEGTSLREECIATRDLIANYTIDVKYAKAHLVNSGMAPEFPDAEWKSILSGLAVNLDAVFSGRYSTEHDTKITHDVGDFTISTREAQTSKTVKSAGDWFIAWNETAAATTFAFPHRSKECQDYGKHVLGLFAAFAEEHHKLIFNYDKAVRKRVALRRDLLLTDLAEFNDLRVQFLDVRGANSNSQTQTTTGRRSTKRSNDACLRWNRGTCPSTAERCTYRHICSYCRNANHTNPTCPNKPKTDSNRGQRE
jgi:hypothetical protein